MFMEEFAAVTKTAKAKAQFLKSNPLGYVLASMLAGAYIGFGIPAYLQHRRNAGGRALCQDRYGPVLSALRSAWW